MKGTFRTCAAIGLGILTVASIDAQQSPGSAPATAAASSARTAKDGIFNESQRKRGADLYEMVCASCHGLQFQGGGMSPTLAGEEFTAKWKTRTVSVLADRIRLTMPSDNPESLTPQQTADLVALMLSVNGYPSGASELPADNEVLKTIRIEPASGTTP